MTTRLSFAGKLWLTINHDRIKLCQDREITEWIPEARYKALPDTTVMQIRFIFVADRIPVHSWLNVMNAANGVMGPV